MLVCPCETYKMNRIKYSTHNLSPRNTDSGVAETRLGDLESLLQPSWFYGSTILSGSTAGSRRPSAFSNKLKANPCSRCRSQVMPCQQYQHGWGRNKELSRCNPVGPAAAEASKSHCELSGIDHAMHDAWVGKAEECAAGADQS